MNPRPYLAISGVIFFAVGFAHLLRLVKHTPVQVGDWVVSQGVSYVGFTVAWALALWAFRLRRRMPRP